MMTAAASTMLATALEYAARGWPVFPCHSITSQGCSCRHAECDRAGKHPRTANGLTGASVSMMQIHEWWKRWPDANIGIRTGNGLTVLDIDPRSGGDESLSALEHHHGVLPDTVRALTGGGGTHYFFQGDAPCSAGKVGAGIDVRGDGGYVIAPPSSHASGRAYQWDSGAAEQIAPIPAWLTEATRRPRARVSSQDKADGIIAGGRNNHLTSLAGSMRRRDMSEAAIRAALLTENAARCMPPLDEREVTRIATSVVKYQPAQSSPPEDGSDWKTRLEIKTKKGGEWEYQRVLANVITILSEHEHWRDRLRFNEFAERLELQGQPWTDADTTVLREWLQRKENGFQIDVSKADAYDGALVVGRAARFHPVREYLQPLVWDGVARLDTMWTVYYGTPDTAYARGVARMWMISAVARVMRPGCQVDYMPVLEGLQRAGKSSSLRRLAGSGLLLDSGLDLQNLKSAYEVILGKWIVELAELDACGKAAVSRIKAFLTSPADHFRASYDRVAETHLRQCVFIGTTNEERYLQDATGGGRFWPIRCQRIDRDALEQDRDQLWAEARFRFDRGEQWWPDEAFFDLANSEQEDRYQSDPWETPVGRWLGPREGITTHDVLTQALGLDKGHLTRGDEMRCASVLRRLGLTRVERPREEGERVRRYFRESMVQQGPTSDDYVGP